MSYQLLQNIDKNKVFIVNRSEIEGRLDPKMMLFNRKVKNSIYNKFRLRDILIEKPQYGASEPGVTRDDPKSPRYIRITDIDEYGLISHEDLGVTANLTDEKYVLHENDILIARSGATVGKSYIHKKSPYTCFFAGYLIRFVINPQKALPDFIFAYTQTKTYKEWVNAIQRPSGQPNINAEEYKSLEIPLPDMDQQQVIVDIIKSAYFQKNQKESEAQQLLESIDTYLLNELGILIPENATKINSRIFYTKRRELEDRLDPIFNKNYSIIKNISSCYPWKTLNDIVLNNGQYGANESAIDYTEGNVRYIRITDIDEWGNLKQEDKKSASCINSAFMLRYNDILFARSGSVGRCYIHKDLSEPSIYAGYLIRFDIDTNKIDPDYLFYYCNSKLYKFWVSTIQRPAVQANINAKEYRSLRIPLPKQISAIRQKAKALQEEGKAILERAKKEVEQMILGEA